MFDLTELKTKLANHDFNISFDPSDDSICIREEVIPNIEIEFSLSYNSERTYYRSATYLQPEEKYYKFEVFKLTEVIIYIKNNENDTFEIHEEESDFLEIEDVLHNKFNL